MTLEQLSFCFNLNGSIQTDDCLTPSEKILAIASKVNEMITQINTNTTDIEAIEVDVNLPVENSGRIDALEIRMTTVEGDVVTINSRLDTIDGQISTINTSLAGNASAIALNAGSISAIEVRLGTVEGDIVTLQGDLTALTGRVTTAEGDVSALDVRLTTLEGDVNAIDVRLTTAEGKITTLEADVTQLRTDVDNITLGATQLITSFLATNPSASKLEITLADDFVDNGVYFIVNPRTLDGTGMTISKDAGVTELAVKDETGVQVIGSAYNGNDVIWVRYRLATTDFIMLTPVSVSGFETRLSGAESDILDILNGSQTVKKAEQDQNGDVIDLTYLKLANIDAVKKQTGALPTDLQWVADGNVFYYDITLSGFTCLVGDAVDVNDLASNEVELALVQSAGIFYAERQTDTTVRLKATLNVDLSTINYNLVVHKDGVV